MIDSGAMLDGVSPTHELERRIIRYYEESEKHFRWIWDLDRSLALHYGHWGLGATTHFEAVADMNRRLAERACIRRAERVLDAGCGVGGSAIFLARSLACEVLGINIVERQLQLAQRSAERLGVTDRVRFQRADFTRSDLAAGSFDVVWFLESACHAQSKRALLAEAHRLLKPGGRVVVGDFFRASRTLSPKEERLLQLWERAWAVPAFVPVESFRLDLEAEGFQQVSFSDESRFIERSARRLYWAYYFGMTTKTVRRLWSRSTPTKFDNVRSCRWQELARRSGAWSYQIAVGHRSAIGC